MKGRAARAQGISRIRHEGQCRRPCGRRHHRRCIRRHRHLDGRRYHHADRRRGHWRSRFFELLYSHVGEGHGDQPGGCEKAGRGAGLGQFPDTGAEFPDHRLRAVHRHSPDEPVEEEGCGSARRAAGTHQGPGAADRDPRSPQAESLTFAAITKRRLISQRRIGPVDHQRARFSNRARRTSIS